MSTIQKGDRAPDFDLPGLNGQQSSLQDALARGPVLAAFFKITCPVCQFTFPFLERLYQAYGGDGATFWAISQDNAEDTRDFCREYGVTFPALLDEDGYPASNAYGLTNVPSFYLFAPDGSVRVASVGFSKKAIEKISEELAHFLGRPQAEIFHAGEVVPSSKAG